MDKHSTKQNLKQNKFIKFTLPKIIFRITNNNNMYTKKRVSYNIVQYISITYHT